MNEEAAKAAKAEIAALSEQMIDLAKNKGMGIYVSALIHTLRVCADVAAADVRHEIGRIMLRVGGLLVNGTNFTKSDTAASVPSSTSIH